MEGLGELEDVTAPVMVDHLDYTQCTCTYMRDSVIAMKMLPLTIRIYSISTMRGMTTLSTPTTKMTK